ncbi:LPXTG cell wall anchor domain-containing protein [Xylanimonas protaetiae]|nr:LPXTG cell wall anchor domain-containing protein [Xylanimonas protaetiae]
MFEIAAAAAADPTPGPTPTAAPTSGGTSGGTTSAAAAAGGQLPQTGIEDAPAVAWVAGLLAVAALAFAADRGLRRRAGRARA